MKIANVEGESNQAAGVEAYAAAWQTLHDGAGLRPIRSAADYDRMVELLDELVDMVGADETHPLAAFLQLVGDVVEQYDEEHFSLPEAPPREILRYLMVEHGLRQVDLKAELGSQSVVSEILAGQRIINGKQARALAGRFGVSPAVFL